MNTLLHWTTNTLSNFGSHPDLNPDLGIFEGIFYHCGIWEFQQIQLITREVVKKFL